MKIIFLPFLALLISLTCAKAYMNHPASVAASAEKAIEHASLQGDSRELSEPVTALDEALIEEPNNSALLYTRAYAHYVTVASAWSDTSASETQRELESAIALLDRVHETPWTGEAAAMKIDIFSRLLRAKGGVPSTSLLQKLSQASQTAAMIAPENPRTLLFRAMSIVHAPRVFGVTDAGSDLLQHSIEAFEKEDETVCGPHWGQVDALTLLGVAKRKSGDKEGAQKAWEKALRLEPNDKWVKALLRGVSS